MVKFRKFSALLIGAALCLSACNGVNEPDLEAKPALWLVSDSDTKIYLFGTVHALPRRANWNGGLVGQGMAEADKLVLELAPSQSAKAGAIFQRLAPRTAPLPVEERLSGAPLAAYQALSAKQKSQMSAALDDWALMIMLGQSAAQEAGLDPRHGVEAGLTQYFSKENKPISGLETAEAQLMMFEMLPAATQRILLEKSLMKSGQSRQDVQDLLSAWASGDVAALENRILADMASTPAAYHALITDRNRRWAAWAVQQMDKPIVIFVAVGAGHLVGPEGLPKLLEQQGLDVRRLQ